MKPNLLLWRWVAVASLTGIACGQCVPVRGSAITAGDLASVDATFKGLPAGTFVAFAPEPGSQRILKARESELLARANGLSGTRTPDTRGSGFGDVCFEVPVGRVDPEVVRSSMVTVLPANATLTIVAAPSEAAPSGEIRFPLAGLDAMSPVEPARTWRGYVVYGGNRRFSLTARVRVSAEIRSLIAARDLPAGEALTEGSLAVVSRTSSNPADFRISKGDIAVSHFLGLAPKFRIPQGSEVRQDQLGNPPLIRAGDSIRVEVRNGRTRLGFHAIAMESAHRNELSLFRNPDSGKVFRARVQSESLALVVIATADRKDGDS